MSRILGLDYGERRLGFALSDPTEMLALPCKVVCCSSREQALQETAKLCLEMKAEKLVVGLPVNMNGSRGFQSEKILKFIQDLSPRLSIPVETWDERLSTQSAEKMLISAGTSREKRRLVIDKLAAQIMLQSYLDARIPNHEQEEPCG